MTNQSKIKEGTLSIKVSTEVVSHLSLGLYRNFARAVKELISNSYDAGATEVKIKLDLDSARIIIRDNGSGMNISEVRDKFLTIGYPTPLTGYINELRRKRIGTFGIGCLSVFPYCEKLQVVTKKRDQDEIVELKIDTNWFFKEGGTFRLIEQAKVPYRSYPSDLPKELGETIIVLEEIKPHIIEELRQEEPKGKSSIDKYSGFDKFKWTLSQYAPIQFPQDKRELRDFSKDPGAVPMRLWLDGEELHRNVPEGVTVLEKDQKQFGSVSLKYAIMTTMRPIEPEEARGLQLRLRDVAIGLPRDFDVTKMTGKVLGKLNYICGEVQILSGLDFALMIDRDSFSYTQEVSDIYDFFRRKLIQWNDILEKWASEDKEIYESLINVKAAESVISELRKANVIRFSRERLRIPKAQKLERKAREVLPQHQRLVKALSKAKGYKIVSEKGKVSVKQSPVKVIPRESTILVYEDHPDLLESMEVEGRRLMVKYDEWDFSRTPYSICKLSDEQKAVTFNTSHPLFKSKVNDRIIRQLSAGVLLISARQKDGEQLLKQLNRLIEQALLS